MPGRKRCEAPQVTWFKKVTWSGTISLIISRYDSELLNDKAIIVNERLTQRFPKTEIIDNSNLDRECVGLKGLHLHRVGNRHLAMNFKQVLNNI